MGQRDTKLEREYQIHVLGRVRGMFDGCIILKNDEQYQQGIPDWSVFWVNCWGFLEIKRFPTAVRQPNQEFFIAEAARMCFGAFVYPENEEEVLYAMEQAFRARWKARFPSAQ